MKKLLCAFALCWPLAGQAGFDAGPEARQRDGSAKTLHEWRSLAEAGDANAQYNLGVMYDFGKGVQEDDAEAARWFRLAAEQGDAMAQFNLGLMYGNGEGVSQDDAEAVKWYRLAAEQGDARADRRRARSQREVVRENPEVRAERRRTIGIARIESRATVSVFSVAVPCSAAAATMNPPKIGARMSYDCSGPWVKHYDYRAVSVTEGVYRMEGEADGKTVWLERP